MEFTGLSQLQEVGRGWLVGCTALESVDFGGLNQLQSVDRLWLARCKSLTTVLFDNYTTFDKWFPKLDLRLMGDVEGIFPIDEQRIPKIRCNSLAAIARMKGTYTQWDDNDVGGASRLQFLNVPQMNAKMIF